MDWVRKYDTLENCLYEAFQNNAVISSDGLDSGEFIFVRKHKAHYEDGGCFGHFSKTREFLLSSPWAQRHRWHILGYMSTEEKKAIDNMPDTLFYQGDTKATISKILGITKEHSHSNKKEEEYMR